MDIQNTSTPNKRNILHGPCYLKMLVGNVVAGSIIGKNGSVITQIEQETGCAMKLSPSYQFFPGTQDRVLVLSGDQEQINHGMMIIIEKIIEVSEQDQSSNRLVVKLVLPKSAVSGIIGKGGQQIKHLQETTGAKIQISNREEGLNERIITMSGAIEQVQSAASATATSIQGDNNLKDHMYVIYNKFSNNNNGGNNMNIGGINGINGGLNNLNALNAMGGGLNAGGLGTLGGLTGSNAGNNTANNMGINSNIAVSNGYNNVNRHGNIHAANFQYNQPNNSPHITQSGPIHNQDLLNNHCEIYIQMNDQCVGPVIGKNGVYLSEIINGSGARVQISQKGDLIPGTSDRRVTISGTIAAVHTAHIMLLQRLEHVVQQFKT